MASAVLSLMHMGIRNERAGSRAPMALRVTDIMVTVVLSLWHMVRRNKQVPERKHSYTHHTQTQPRTENRHQHHHQQHQQQATIATPTAAPPGHTAQFALHPAARFSINQLRLTKQFIWSWLVLGSH